MQFRNQFEIVRFSTVSLRPWQSIARDFEYKTTVEVKTDGIDLSALSKDYVRDTRAFLVAR